MALGATILKAELNISDLNTHHYADYPLVVAQHPSETPERAMIRILAFAHNASETLKFGKGLSNEEEAALWEVDFSGVIQHWIDVGLPDETRIKKACSRADKVSIYSYGRTADLWWNKNKALIESLTKVTVFNISADDGKALAALHSKQMSLAWTIQDSTVYLGDTQVELNTWKLSEPKG